MTFKRWFLATAAIMLLAGYLGRTALLTAIGRYLVVEDPPTPADVIAVPSGSFPDRILEAVALYKAGLAPRILICRERENAAYKRLRVLGVAVPRGFELNREVALQLGVPAQALVVVDQPPGSTFSEARVVLEYARRHGYGSILLVTSKYHTRRASRIYRHLAGGSERIVVRAARDDAFRADAWWRNRAWTRRVVIEYEKLAVFLLLDRWRTEPLPAASAEPARATP